MHAGSSFVSKWLGAFGSGLLLWAALSLEAATLIPKGAGWRYLDNGVNQFTAWKELAFDDDNWGFGHAELGYGDEVDGVPEVTLLSPGPNVFTRHPTYYFRRFFYVANAESLTNAMVRLRRDDGAVVYINGVEVFRSGIPEGPVTFDTLASSPEVDGRDELRYVAEVFDPGLLFNGINLIAVEVHQADLLSPDLSFDLELLTNIDPTAEFVTLLRGPYLQLLSTNTVTIRWRTLEDAISRVRFGSTPDNLTREVVVAEPTDEHEVTLTGLLPDTRYYYSIGAARTTLAAGNDYFFVTAPMAGKPTRVWVIGDSGTANADARAVFDRYRELTGSRYTDVWLMLGDNAYGIGTDGEYQRAVFEMYPELLRQTAVWSTIGNHETYSTDLNGAHAYYNIFSWPRAGQIGGEPSGTESYYSFDYGNIHFVCLDSEQSDNTPGSEMLTWLEEDLAGNTKDWLIAFWHSPPYTKGSHDSDALLDSGGNLIEMRENVVPLLESYGVDLVLCGHSHDYERSYLINGHYGFSSELQPSMILDQGSGRPEEHGAYRKPIGAAANQGAVYVVAGSSGWAHFQTGRHPIMHTALMRMGSLVLDIDGSRLDARFLRETGAVDDYFSIVKGGAIDPVRITGLRIEQGEITAQFRSRPGKFYIIEKSSSFPPTDWIPVGEEFQAIGATTIWTDFAQPEVEQCFFRVIEVR